MIYKIIRQLKGSFSSKVELIQDENDKFWVLKTVNKKNVYEIYNEKYFLNQLKKFNLNSIQIHDSRDLLPNQIILEYLKNSETVGNEQNPKVFKIFGEEVKKLHQINHYDSAIKIDNNGVLQKINWTDFVIQELNSGLERIKSKQINFSDQTINLIKSRIINLSRIPFDRFSLLHCDLHTNNALWVRSSNKVYLFDKGSAILSGHPYYDLAVVLIEFPHLFGFNKLYKDDDKLICNFFEGYGFNFLKKDKDLCLNYILLRSINRIGTPFNPYLYDLIISILNLPPF
jgi:Phosphotransferase enzyme family